MYSPELLDHFEHPRNVGEVVRPDVSAELSNPACGDIVKLTLKIKSDRIDEIRFKAKGCVPAMACGSALTELVQGKFVTQAVRVTREDVVQAVGGLPEASGHAAQLVIDALVAALAQVNKR
ncbi:MAG TPA: iron-sulfur cluster assembly scaffold protein [Terriglobales bacterium]|nr:iron-sulfur cluster assembly scaffold protein [Terriglobales bacterium]